MVHHGEPLLLTVHGPTHHPHHLDHHTDHHLEHLPVDPHHVADHHLAEAHHLEHHPIVPPVHHLKVTDILLLLYTEAIQIFKMRLFAFTVMLLLLLQEYIPYQYDATKIPECALTNQLYYNTTFCLQDDYYPV